MRQDIRSAQENCLTHLPCNPAVPTLALLGAGEASAHTSLLVSGLCSLYSLLRARPFR